MGKNQFYCCAELLLYMSIEKSCEGTIIIFYTIYPREWYLTNTARSEVSFQTFPVFATHLSWITSYCTLIGTGVQHILPTTHMSREIQAHVIVPRFTGIAMHIYIYIPLHGWCNLTQCNLQCHTPTSCRFSETNGYTYIIYLTIKFEKTILCSIATIKYNDP